MWRDRFLKKWGEHAALGLVCNFDLTKEALRSGIDKHTTRVLLNRQDQEPFRGMWLVPGGYMNPKKGDRQLPDTVCRRLKKLTHIGGRFVAENTDLLAYPFKNTRRQAPAWLKKVDEDLSPPEGEKPGRLKHITSRLIKKSERDLVDFSRDYTEAVLRYSHAPTDTCLYLVRGTRSLSTLEQEIQTTEDSDLKWWSIQEIECTSKIPSHLKDLLLYVLTKKHTDLWELEEGLRHAR
jgi:ADP-ribose pyrophosphatase YjhB (NUDIX family)